ncbi:ATP-binding cassette domain-containing protein [Streptomyces sp. NPDC001351]|uniref:ATP-binding cassette domain-containing protein n=1 Tax=Streptomyces sp. NPDC001351 TaxID=3364564 RepID=UPI0036BE5120
MTVATPLLAVRGLTKAFGSTRALDGVDLTVGAGEVHALLGANGAGKSTLLAIVAGVESADAGELNVAVEDSRDHPPVAIVHQELSLLPHLSVLENIATHELLLAGRGRGRRRRARAAAGAALASLGQDAAIDLGARVGDLPLDRQQMVEIARGLAQGSRLLLLDEPTASLNRPQAEKLYTVLRGLTASGVGVVLVSHRFREIREVADVATVLRDGRTVVDRVPLTDIDDRTLLAAMVGDAARALDRPVPKADPAAGEPPLLELLDSEAPLRVDPGEVVGITSLDPSAASDLLLRAWGDRPHPPGQTMRVLGLSTARWSPQRALRAGAGYVSGDRARDGVLGDLSVLEHLLGPQRVARRRLIARPDVATARQLVDRFAIKLSDLAAPPEALSGGNQQKVLFARWAPLGVRLLLLDDPTRGVDIHAKVDIFQAVDEVAAAGGGALWWSSDPEELAARCHRVHVLAGPRVTATLSGSQLTETQIVDALNASSTTAAEARPRPAGPAEGGPR